MDWNKYLKDEYKNYRLVLESNIHDLKPIISDPSLVYILTNRKSYEYYKDKYVNVEFFSDTYFKKLGINIKGNDTLIVGPYDTDYEGIIDQLMTGEYSTIKSIKSGMSALEHHSELTEIELISIITGIKLIRLNEVSRELIECSDDIVVSSGLKSGIKIGVVTTDSSTTTMNKSIHDGNYNQARAHLGNCLEIASVLGLDCIYDIGESLDNSGKYDDIELLSKRFNMSIIETTSAEFFDGGFNIVIFVYNYLDSEDKVKYVESIIEKCSGFIYYASDDEIYYPDYFLNRVIQNKIKIDVSKFICILNGHSYMQMDIGIPEYHYPMIPWLKFDKDLVEPKIDFFLNCHHNHQVAADYVRAMPRRSFMIFTNKSVLPYIKNEINSDKVSYLVSEKANTELTTIMNEVRKCKYYLIPTTYYHIHSWYRSGHNVQDVMYTHKYLESYYANRLALGDLSEDEFKFYDELSDVKYIPRDKYYESRLDPMDDLIKRVLIKSKLISDKISKYYECNNCNTTHR